MLQAQRIILCLTAVLLLATAGKTQNLLVNPNFDSDASGWTLFNINAESYISITWEPSSGNPGGAVKLMRDDGSLASNGHRYYQAIPVTVGQSYVIQGQWKGNLGTATGTGENQGYNWAEIFVGFAETATPDSDVFGTYYLKKRFKPGDASSYGTDANGQWDWQPITDSPAVEQPYPTYFTATAPYMLLSFNIGGQDLGGQAWYLIDNLKVMACSLYPAGDINADCQVNFADMAIIANQWLTCTIDPASSCW